MREDIERLLEIAIEKGALSTEILLYHPENIAVIISMVGY